MKNISNSIKKISKIFLFTQIISLCFINKSYAYFDPGSGTFIVQAIIAFFSAVIFYLGYPVVFAKKIIKKIKNKFSKNNAKNKQ